MHAAAGDEAHEMERALAPGGLGARLHEHAVAEELKRVPVKLVRAGFGDDEVKAFVTKDSTYKDQLQIPGIGSWKNSRARR